MRRQRKILLTSKEIIFHNDHQWTGIVLIIAMYLMEIDGFFLL
jgi:hypothetical protein